MSGRLAAAVILAAILTPSASAASVHHRLEIVIAPNDSQFTARDRVLLPDGGSAPARVAFTLHAGLEPVSPDGEVVLLDARGLPSRPAMAGYSISLPAGAGSFTLRYGGAISHPLGEVGTESARGQRHTVGAIGPEGVYLDGASGWYPRLQDDTDVAFDLSVSLPEGWDALSQGDRAFHERTGQGTTVRWVCDLPQEGIWLAAGPWTAYARSTGAVEGMVFLREPDAGLAGRYLDATERYLAIYGALLGPYPYGKFAVAENFWETGYGMPSFALLGPRVVRFPFILESSFPHEILHNWWGNGVRIDYASGNWGEGLTAYLADHLVKELKGEDSTHRQENLQKYADYVLQGRDIPLSEFRSRHGSVTEAVGYGKGMMLFHMLRRGLGDEAFVGGLRELYRRHLNRRAGFAQLRDAFEAVSGRDLGRFFDQWVGRAGAPGLELEKVRSEPSGDGHRLAFALRQAQEGEPFRLSVPVAVTVEGREEALVVEIPMDGRTALADIPLPGKALRVDADPVFDVFRRLDRREVPPALTQAFGAMDAVLVQPAAARGDMKAAYGRLARSLAHSGPGKVEVADDGTITSMPKGRSVWVLGSENRLASQMEEALDGYPVDVGAGRVTLDGVAVETPSAVVLAARRPDDPELALLWIVLGDPAAADGLARKLPHYHKYSYLAFAGPEPENVAKGRWPVVASPMTAQTGDVHVPMARLPARPPLTGRLPK